MIRKTIIVLLTLSALGMLAARVLTHSPEWAGGWSLRSPSWQGNRFIVHHRCIVFAHDAVRPGQVPDPGYIARVEAHMRKLKEAGRGSPLKGIMEDSFIDSGVLGVQWGRGVFTQDFGLRTDCWVVFTPIWMALVVLATYPAIAFIRGPVRRYRRRKHGLCLKCGYNLTGNESGVCPECGKPVERICDDTAGRHRA